MKQPESTKQADASEGVISYVGLYWIVFIKIIMILFSRIFYLEKQLKKCYLTVYHLLLQPT